MRVEEVKNKEGQVLTTKEGKALLDYHLEDGDTFIPSYNSVMTTETGLYKKHKIKAKVMDKNGSKVTHYGDEELFILLTNSQAEQLKKLALDIELNQNMFIAYSYKNDYGDQIGVRINKPMKEAKKFEDFKE